MKTLLVDGYNVLRSTEAYSHLTEEIPDHTHDAFNRARQTLVTDVATFAGRDYEATIVFDGGGNPQSTGERREVAGIHVIFSPAGTSADSVIEELARAAVKRGREVLVVTSDAATQWTVLGGRVTRMSAAGFVREMSGVHQGVSEAAEQQASKRTLAQRLDSRTREALERLARGER
ncbi:MAG: NYN domain-containing protein [Coriobacteriales bacterium]|nr:NYN domain-containing protein [Coriobacteriales bacterium]